MKKIVIFILALLYGGLFIYTNVINKDEKNHLLISIKEYANIYDTKAVNASYDLLDKQIPGSSGYQVNIQESYDIMKELGYFDTTKIVYDEIEPEITVNDLKEGPIYHGNEKKNTVALNINVAWGEEYVEEMLDILDKYQVKANFFIEGNWANKNPLLVQKIVDAGHLIGNHAYSHADFSKISRVKMAEEIDKTNEILKSYTGKDITYFAPPSGAYNDEALQLVDEKNMRMIMWSVDTIDWQKPSKEVIVNRVLKKVTCGSFVLMHPTENTVLALEDIIIEVAKKGLKIVTLDQMID